MKYFRHCCFGYSSESCFSQCSYWAAIRNTYTAVALDCDTGLKQSFANSSCSIPCLHLIATCRSHIADAPHCESVRLKSFSEFDSAPVPYSDYVLLERFSVFVFDSEPYFHSVVWMGSAAWSVCYSRSGLASWNVGRFHSCSRQSDDSRFSGA